MTDSLPTRIRAALAQVMDPELGRSIADLDMIGPIDIDQQSHVTVTIRLTTPACPLQDRLAHDVTEAVLAVPGVADVRVSMAVMSDLQRDALRTKLRGPTREIPFAQADNRTRVIAVASGKGGVGKSSLTVNLACALAGLGHGVGLIDADVYGHSVPDLLGIPDGVGPTTIQGMDLVVPVESHGLKVMSVGMMKPERSQVVAWRGPMIDRAIGQFLTDVYWGDLGFLLIDLPPGTGDIAIGLGQRLPGADILVVTTPQLAATEVAERAGTMAGIMKQRVVGVVENMSYLEVACPHCGQAQRLDVFGHGGGAEVAAALTNRLGYQVPLLAEIPLEPAFRALGDQGNPAVVADPLGPAARAISALAEWLAGHQAVRQAGVGA